MDCIMNKYIYILQFIRSFPFKTRCRPSKGRRCIPDVDMEVHVETFLNVDLSSSAQSKYKSNSISNFFEEKNQILGFPWCSTREDLSIDVSITNVGLILTKLRWFQLFVKSQISNFFGEKIQIFGFPWCSTREDLSIDVSITNVGLISTKLRWFQLFTKVKIRISNFFEKKIKFLGFHGVVLVKTFPLIVSITNVGLILTKLRWFQLFVKSQISNFKLFWKKKFKFSGFHGVVLVKSFPLMYQLLM